MPHPKNSDKIIGRQSGSCRGVTLAPLMVKQLTFAGDLVTAKAPKSSSWLLPPVQVDFGLSASLPQRCVRVFGGPVSVQLPRQSCPKPTFPKPRSGHHLLVSIPTPPTHLQGLVQMPQPEDGLPMLRQYPPLPALVYCALFASCGLFLPKDCQLFQSKGLLRESHSFICLLSTKSVPVNVL